MDRMRSQPWWALVVFLTVSTMGCAQFTVHSVMPERASQANGQDGNPDSNLPAIKALIAGERQQFRAVPPSISGAESVSPPDWSPANQVGDASSFPTARSEDVTPARLLGLLLSASHPMIESSQRAPYVQRLGPTTRSAADYSLRDWPVVPPYTFLAPTGSAYPGTIRCVPDYLGGQRCHSAP